MKKSADVIRERLAVPGIAVAKTAVERTPPQTQWCSTCYEQSNFWIENKEIKKEKQIIFLFVYRTGFHN